MFMPVGTKGCLKALTMNELTSDPALQCPIILANTYHLAIQPGTELLADNYGLHNFQGLNNIMARRQDDIEESQNNSGEQNFRQPLPYNLLTDSGGFQMVSLAKLSQVTEEGVSFENPYNQKSKQEPNVHHSNQNEQHHDDDEADILLLRPEDSIRHQNNIGSNILMALDDVISSVTEDEQRFVTATHRTLRWYDRCYQYHHSEGNFRGKHQNLFPITQGGLDTDLGGLREQCLAGFRYRHVDCNYDIPGFSIGGLAGGEDKDDFWKVVDQCCKALPDDKPRYLMGVGYPLDLVVCTSLGVDMYDCVYPTRTARFGVALVPGKHPGTLKLSSNCCGRDDKNVIQENCRCQACRRGITRARLHVLLKANNPVAIELITQHNIAYMMELVRGMREAILQQTYATFATQFVLSQFPGKANGGEDIPIWVNDALSAAGIDIFLKNESEK
jgi:queuine tRNA-ribosyltransferase catalytic subunit